MFSALSMIKLPECVQVSNMTSIWPAASGIYMKQDLERPCKFSSKTYGYKHTDITSNSTIFHALTEWRISDEMCSFKKFIFMCQFDNASSVEKCASWYTQDRNSFFVDLWFISVKPVHFTWLYCI